MREAMHPKQSGEPGNWLSAVGYRLSAVGLRLGLTNTITVFTMQMAS